ncbi:MAG TPA: hypothetical protein VFN97_05735 [Actinospica sp.]|nr:hypothetical protein [Actinospica sp.]
MELRAIAIGYDAEPVRRDLRSRRVPIENLVHYGTWGGKHR